MAGMTHAQRVDSNRLVDEYFDSLMIQYSYIDNEEPSTEYRLFGETFSAPILGGPLAYMALDKLHESGRAGLAKGLHDAGSGMISAWIEDDELAALVNAGYRVARSVKPFADHDMIYRYIESAERLGALAVCMDIDHIFDESGSFCQWPKGPTGRQTVSDLRGYAESTSLPFILKGVLSPKDAVKCAEAGAAAIVVSNHNNRFPCAVPPLMALEDIKKAVGDSVTVLADGNIVSGVEVFKALALGADGVLVSRAFMKPLAKGPEEVTAFFNSMTAELKCCMANTGAASVSEISPDCIVRRTW